MSEKDCDTGCSTATLPDDPDVKVVMGGALADLQRGADRLGQRGIDSHIVSTEIRDGAGCCKQTFYLIVATDDAADAMAVFDSEWKRGLSDEQIAALEAAAAIVIDPDAPETTCPACLTTFATGPVECPECGLAIG